MASGPGHAKRFEAARDLLRAHKPTEALEGLDSILAEDPKYLPALVSRGSALLALRREDEAEAAWRGALGVYPGQDALFWNLGLLLIERERPEDALAIADQILARQPRQPRALLLRGEALNGLSRFEEAAAVLRRIPRTDPNALDAQTREAVAEEGLRNYDAARDLLDKVLARKPDDAVAAYRRAYLRLSRHDFGGWADYEARWRLQTFMTTSGGAVTPQVIPRLTIAPTREQLTGQRVLLLAEQGIGDNVMFASIFPDLAAVAKSVGCICDGRLVELFRASFPNIAFVSPREARVAVSAVDHFVAVGSLAGAFRPDVAAFPGTPYLTPRPQARARWAERLGPKTRRLRVGLSWRGGTPRTRRNVRSLDWSQLAPLLALDDCEFVSLQYGDVAADLAAAPVPIRAFASEDIEDFEDLAALTAELDLVISVQTSLVHLCGAIGQTCLTLVPQNPEWRYGASGSIMPWYNSVRIFRQANLGDWEPVVADAIAAVQARLAAPAL